VVIVQ
jgi:hypothetical protein